MAPKSLEIPQDETIAQRSVVPRILAIDDKAENTAMLASILVALECEIITATDGKSALKQISVAPPDLVLLDVLMPEMDGFEVCRQLHANWQWKEIPVIFLSALNDRELVARALAAGAVDYVTKPFHRAELLTRVRTHLELKAARDGLKQLAAEKDELAGILANVIKNQLSRMHRTSRLLRETVHGGQAGKLPEMVNDLADSNERLLAFVKEFLANSTAENKTTFPAETVSVSALAAVITTRHRESASRKNIKIEMKLHTGAAMVRTDAGALEQIMDNLVSNAVKFSPADKHIFVSVQQTQSHVEWAVRDQGPGFSEEDKKRMYNRYCCLSAQPTGGEPSCGLGLSIVRKLAEAIKGDLTLNSSPGAGAIFILRLPRLRQ